MNHEDDQDHLYQKILDSLDWDDGDERPPGGAHVREPRQPKSPLGGNSIELPVPELVP